jgi:hypothetical protein
MARPADYADTFREVYLTLALIPVAGLHTAVYWWTESLERTSRLATDVIATTALARSGQGAGAVPRGHPDPAADVLARELLDSSRTYVRAMVSLPADSAIYFTGEVERRLDALRQHLLPDAAVDLEAYIGTELQRVLDELDRLSVIARAAAGRGSERPRPRARRSHPVVDEIERLRTRVRTARDGLERPGARRGVEAIAEPSARPLKLERARFKLETAFREAATLLPRRRRAPLTVASMGRLLGELAAAAVRGAPARRRTNGQAKGKQGAAARAGGAR